MKKIRKTLMMCMVLGAPQAATLMAAYPAESLEKVFLSSQNLPEDQRFQIYSDLLGKVEKPAQKALVYEKIAELYLGIRDKSEALNQLDLAVKADPNHSEILKQRDALREEIYPTPSTLQRFREGNKERNLSLNVSLGLEHATNVIQESVNPATPTNKKDTAFVFNGFMSYNPEAKVMGLDQAIQYNLASYSYFKHDNLNLLSNNLEYHLQNDKKLKGGVLSFDRKLALSHVHSDDSSLLWNAKLGFGGTYAMNNGLVADAGLDLFNTEYFDSAYSTEEGLGWDGKFGLGSFLDKDQQHNLHCGINVLGENLEASASSYDELGARLTYTYTFKEVALQSVAPYAGVKSRRYDGLDVGATEKRKDDRWELGINAVCSFVENQSWTANLSTLVNDSNISAYHYRNTQVSLMYGVSF